MSEQQEAVNGVTTTTAESDGAPQQKSAKQLEKEAKKAAKLAKFNEKKDKKATEPAPVKEVKEVRFIYRSNGLCNFSINFIHAHSIVLYCTMQ